MKILFLGDIVGPSGCMVVKKHLKKIVEENKSFFHPEVGYNFRMPNILAAMGVAQLENIDEYIAIKRNNAKLYNEFLSEVKGIYLPAEKDYFKNCYWLYSMVIKDERGSVRDKLIWALKDKGIETRPFFSSLHNMKPFKECRRGAMSITDDVVANGINLPSSVGLKKEDVVHICNIIKEQLNGNM